MKYELSRKSYFEDLEYFFDIAIDMFCVASFDGYFKVINKQWETVLGWTEEELKSKPFIDYVHPEDRVATITETQKLSSGNNVLYFENRYLCKNGNYIWLEWKSFSDLEKKQIYAVARDVTQQKKERLDLQKSEATILSIFRAAPIGIGLVSNRFLLNVNDMICFMTGYSREELIGKNARILYPTDEDYQYVGNEKYRQIKLYGTGTVETRWQRKDGTIISVLMSSTPLDLTDLTKGVTFSALDITQRLRLENERIELERKMLQTQKLES